MSKIFCLETEWTQSKHSLKYRSSAQSLLEFLEISTSIPFVFRNVATETDFEFYIRHLTYDSYNSFDIIYLCFHGCKSEIDLADGGFIDLMEFAKAHKGIFQGRNVHFGCCSTLNMSEEEIRLFKRETGARMITGYATDVEFVNSFIFELWLLNTIAEHPDYAAKRIKDMADMKMSYYTGKFQFVAY